MSDLELTETIFNVYGVKYHKLIEGDNTYLTPYGKKDTEGNIYLEGKGLIKLINHSQLESFVEFNKGNLKNEE
jgi:hypothetical protein|tara:strand:+ start:177 stop:395 length:219 start_codon:yes stop_codon:yes gene_type:complete